MWLPDGTRSEALRSENSQLAPLVAHRLAGDGYVDLRFRQATPQFSHKRAKINLPADGREKVVVVMRDHPARRKLGDQVGGHVYDIAAALHWHQRQPRAKVKDARRIIGCAAEKTDGVVPFRQ